MSQNDDSSKSVSNVSESIRQKGRNLAYRVSDLRECAQEPIPFCGAIQPFTALFVARGHNYVVEAVSDNVPDLLGLPGVDSVLGKPLHQVLSADEEAVRMWALADNTNLQLGNSNQGYFSAGNCVHYSNLSLFEFERLNSSSESLRRDFTADILNGLRSALSVREAAHFAAREIRKITNYDRVMIYQFDEDWNGEVLAEDKAENLQPFLELRFPATDIPAQVRALFAQKISRMIVDSQAEAVPLLSKTIRPIDVDLSPTLGRAVSPFHLQYLENMGVRATFAVPIILDSKLWGLISCHHSSGPKALSRELRSALDLSSNIFSLRINEITLRNRIRNKSDTFAIMQKFLNTLVVGGDFAAAVKDSARSLLGLTNSNSLYISIADQSAFLGEPVDADLIENLKMYLRSQPPLEVWSSDSLSKTLPQGAKWSSVAGALAAPLSPGFGDMLIWFRKAETQEVHWGGQPKLFTVGSEAARNQLNPRNSFQEWVQRVEGRSRPWTADDLECAKYFLFGLMREVFARMQALSRAFRAEKEASDAKDLFISTMSHELRTPAGVIISWLELLKDYPAGSPESLTALSIIDRNAKTQLKLIDELLDASRISAGRVKINVKPEVSLNEILESLIKGLEPIAKGKLIDLSLDVEGQVLLMCDAERIRQVVANLLSNALKFTGEGGFIRVSAKVVGDFVEIQVQDSGAGFDPALSEKIFDRFYQTNAAAFKSGGLGLGLSIVKGLTELHGGKVRASSSGLGLGATFTVELPLRPPITDEKPAVDFSKRQTSSVKLLSGLKVLVVEDNEEAGVALKLICERSGAEVALAANGLEAFKLLQNQPFDLVLSDLNMPEMSGFEMIRRWRELESQEGRAKTPAIAISAFTSSKDIADALEAGFNIHMAKPVSLSGLMENIKKLILLRSDHASQSEWHSHDVQLI